jgi:hypothetical protein
MHNVLQDPDPCICRMNESAFERDWEDVIARCKTHPEEAAYDGFTPGATALHWAIYWKADVKVVIALLKAWPQGASRGGEWHTPLIWLFQIYNHFSDNSVKVVEAMLQYNPPCIVRKTKEWDIVTCLASVASCSFWRQILDVDLGQAPFTITAAEQIYLQKKNKDDTDKKKKHESFNGANLWTMLLLLVNAEWRYRLNRSAPTNIISALAGCPSRDWSPKSQSTLIRLACRLHPEQLTEANPAGDLPLHFAAAARMTLPTVEDLEVDKQNEWMNQREKWEEGDDPTRCNRPQELVYLEEELVLLQEGLFDAQYEADGYPTGRHKTRAYVARGAYTTAAIKEKLDLYKQDIATVESQISVLTTPVCDCPFCKDQRYPLKDLRNKEAIQVLLEMSPDAAKYLNHRGDLPLHIAITTRKTWAGGIKDLVDSHPQSLTAFGSAKLLPFQMAAAQNTIEQCSHMNSVNTVFELLRACPTAIKPHVTRTSVAAKDIKSTRKGKRKRTSNPHANANENAHPNVMLQTMIRICKLPWV